MDVRADPFGALGRRLDQAWRKWRPKLIALLRWAVRWGQHIPWGVRTVLGSLLIVGGVFSFLPVLGVWMLPLGAVLVALDVPSLRRRLRDYLQRSGPTRQRRHRLSGTGGTPIEEDRAMAKREPIDTGSDKRYVRRDADKVKESNEQGRSLAKSIRQAAKNEAKPGQGDRGDRRIRKS